MTNEASPMRVDAIIVFAEEVMDKRISATVVALAACVVSASQVHAQAKDSTPTFAIFGGPTFSQGSSAGGSILNAEFGGSGDFRLSKFPLPLRATLAFRRESHDWTLTPMKFGTLSLDAIGKPVPRIFGIQPYLLGGLGVATRSEFDAVSYGFDANGLLTQGRVYASPRQTWAFAEGGVGLELGRHLFVQMKMMMPVASQGPILTPMSIGFRFWD